MKPSRIEPHTRQPFYIVPDTTFEVTLETLTDAYRMHNGSIFELYNAGVYDGYVRIPYSQFHHTVMEMLNV